MLSKGLNTPDHSTPKVFTIALQQLQVDIRVIPSSHILGLGVHAAAWGTLLHGQGTLFLLGPDALALCTLIHALAQVAGQNLELGFLFTGARAQLLGMGVFAAHNICICNHRC